MRGLLKQLEQMDKEKKLAEADNSVLALDLEQAVTREKRAAVDLDDADQQIFKLKAQVEQLMQAVNAADVGEATLKQVWWGRWASEFHVCVCARFVFVLWFVRSAADDLTTAASTIGSLEEQVTALSAENKQLRDETAKLQADLAVAATQHADAAQSAEAKHQRQLDELMAANSKKSQEAAKLQTALDAAKAEAASMSRASPKPDAGSAVETATRELAAQLAARDAEIEALKSQLDTAEQSADAAAEQVQDLKRQLETTKSDLAMSEDASAGLRRRLAQADEAVADSEAMLAELQGQMAAKDTLSRGVGPSPAPSEHSVADSAASEASAAAAASMDGLRAEVEAMRQQLSEAAAQRVAATKAAQGLAASNASHLEAHEQQMTLCKRKLELAQDEIATLNAQVAKLKEQAKNSKAATKALEDTAEQLAEATANITRLERELAMRNKGLLEASSKASALQRQYNDASRELTDLQDKMAGV